MHRRGKMGMRGSVAGRPAAIPSPHLTGSRTRAVAGWEPPGGGLVLATAIGREMQFGQRAGSSWNASTAHGTQSDVHRSGAMPSPQQFVRMTSQGAANSIENIEQTATRIRLARRALSRNRGRGPGLS